MYNMYINSNYLLLHIAFDFEHVPVSVSHNKRKISSQSEHSTSKAWMLKDSKGSVTKLGSKKKFVSMPSVHKSKYSFKVSSTGEAYKSIYIKVFYEYLLLTIGTVLYYIELYCTFI